MANIKEFTIKINGIQESIDGIEALSNKLNALDLQINKERKIDVEVTMPQTPSQQTNGTTTSSSGGRNNSGLSEEAKLQNQIIQNAEKITAARTNDYQVLLRQKETLKDINVQQKANVAETALQTKEYANTMQGLKQELADIKQVMQTTDLADDKFKDLVGRAGQLTQKLKDIEAEYGTFGRNVGNYASAAEGFKNFSIEVAGATQEFNSAKQALMELKKEMQTLSTKKDMGLISDEEAERLKSLIPVVKELESSIKDAGKPMDALMDTMQSVVAIAQAGKGLSALFGFDNGKIEESIQKLVALQNVMQSLQTIQKQMQTGEGIGGWLTKGNAAIDAMTKKMLGATKAAKGLSLALKGIGIGAVVGAVMLLVDAFEDMEEAEKKAEEEAERIKKKIEEQRQTFVNASAQYMNAASRISHLRAEYVSTNNELRKTSILKEASEQFKKFGISVNSVVDAQNILVNQGGKVIEMLRLEGDAAALAALRMEAFKKSFNMLLENGYDVNSAAVIAGGGGLVSELDKRIDEVNQRLTKFRDELGVGIKNGGDNIKKIADNADKELYNLRIANMKEGLNKTIKQLEEERRQKIAKIKSDGVMVGELTLETEKYYDKKIEDAKKEHADRVKEVYEQMWKSIFQINIDNYHLQGEVLEREFEEMSRRLEDEKNKLMNQGISSYGIQAKNQISNSTRETLGIVSQNNNDEVVNDYKKLIDIQREYETSMNALETAKIKSTDEIAAADEKLKKVEEETNRKLEELEREKDFMFENEYESKKYEIEKEIDVERVKVAKLKESYDAELSLVQITVDAKKKLYDEYNAELEQKYDTDEKRALANVTFNMLLEESYTKDLSTMFRQRMSAVEAYWAERLSNERTNAEALYEQNKDIENKEYQDRRRKAKEEADALEKQANESAGKGLMSEKERDEAIDRIWTEHSNKTILLEEEHNQLLIELERKKNDSLKGVNAEYYQDALQELRDFQTSISQLEEKQPVVYKDWGITNLKQTNKNNRELLEAYENMAQKLSEKRTQIIEEYQDGLIDNNIYTQTIREIDAFSADLGTKIDQVKEKLSFGDKWKTMAGDINVWLQAVGQAATSILSSISEITSNHYEKQIEQQEKYIEEYENLLDKQKEATQEYADAVDEIENELSTSRGDRRQQLIDALNAELAAQRASLAEEKRIEKEKERAEEKKKKLEHDQAVAEKRMSVWQARLNAVMAVSMAAVNKWPIPAIPMMALAAAVGAAQIAAAESQNIPSYGSGGVILGRSHREGGVKVLGGRAEVEGGEYITNKVTTSKNVELLEYINSKKKKVDISDMLEFYSSGKPSKTIAAVSPKSKFADGGQIPSLRNDIDISDRMYKAMEDYANRPSYVQVVDIIDRTERLNEVKVISGLEV